jgi:hypothetical protein
LTLGDNTPSLSWFDNYGTASAIGQNQIRLSAEYSLDANVKSTGEHLPGIENDMAGDISRPYKLFNPPLTTIHDVPFSTHTCKTGLSDASNSTILSDFPVESRALLSPKLIIVKKCEMGASTKTSEERTACSRHCYFIYWCILQRVYDQVFPVIKLSDTALVYLMACYTAFLATGHVIGLKSIKSGTVDGYLLTIKMFLKNFDPKSDRDARMFSGAQVITAPIKKVIDEMKRFERQPNQREPWTLQLQSRLFKDTEDKPADSLAKAGYQWYCCTFPAGCRQIECCQPYAN